MNGARLALVALATAVGGLLAATASHGLFFALTGNGSNALASGTVVLTDNGSGGTIVQFADFDAGQSSSGCIRAEYQGSLPAEVRLFGTATGALAPHLTLRIERGTDSAPSFNSCTNFTPDLTNYIGAGPGVVWSGAMSTLGTSWVTGIVDPTVASPESWTTGEVHSYRVLVTVAAAPAGQGKTAALSLRLEARNQ